MKEFLIRNIEIKTVKANSFHYPCEGVYHKKILDCLSVVQAIEGSYDIRLNNGETFSTGEGGVFIAPSHTIQEITHHNGKNGVMKAHWIFIDVIVNESYRFDEVFSFPVISDKRYDKELAFLINSLRYDNPYFQRMQNIYRVLEILYEQSSIKEMTESVKTNIEKYVKENYRNDIKACDIAHFLHCSVSQVFKYTNKYYGISPANYINRIRSQQAENMLLYTNRSVTEIAYFVGFYDGAYFSKLFKCGYGLSPLKYRKTFSHNN